MFQSVGPGELFTIGIVALIVFGPHRLPDMARRIGGYMRELRAAAADIRQGLDAEVRQLKDPIESVTKDLTKPVTEVKDTLAQTADVVKKSADSTTEAVNKSLDEARTAGKVEWVGPEPKTGVKPDEAWDGMNDDVPESIANLPTELPDANGDAPAADEGTAARDAEDPESETTT